MCFLVKPNKFDMKRYVLLLVVVCFPFVINAKKANSHALKWVYAMTKGSTIVPMNKDFSSVIGDKSPEFIGYIGKDYYKMYILFTKVRRLTDAKYAISGSSKVRGIVCPFSGKLDIVETRVFKNRGYGIDDEMKGKFDKRGCCVARFEFKEPYTAKGSGVFKGYALFFWYTGKDGTLHIDDIDSYSDSYCNNLYSGIWINYRSHRTKPCGWGQLRIPNCGDLDIGAAEFSVNPKYKANGWE